MANKTDLNNEVQVSVEEILASKEVKVNKKEAGEIVDAVLEAIQELTKRDGKLQLIGHGTYEVRERAARKGHNPKLLAELKEQGVPVDQAKKQAEIQIQASKSIGFSPAKALKNL